MNIVLHASALIALLKNETGADIVEAFLPVVIHALPKDMHVTGIPAIPVLRCKQKRSLRPAVLELGYGRFARNAVINVGRSETPRAPKTIIPLISCAGVVLRIGSGRSMNLPVNRAGRTERRLSLLISHRTLTQLCP